MNDTDEPWLAAWADYGARLDRCAAIDERLLRESTRRAVHEALGPWQRARGLELLVSLAALGVAVPVLVAHAAEGRYVVAAGGVVVFFAAAACLAVRLLVRAHRLDLAGPVTASQRAVEALRLAEFHATRWWLLGGIAVWLPTALVVFEAVTGIAALARVDLAWLLANLAFGGVVLAVGHVWSRRCVERSDLGPWARRIVDALTGRPLRAAARHLDELARFERDEPRG